MLKKVSLMSPIRLSICTVLLLGCSTAQHQTTPPEGNWVCKAQWSCKQDGADAQCSVVQQSLCVDNVLTVTGLLSIGTAQWSEEKTGSCYASSDTLYGTWSSGKTTAKNDEARRFERETLGGKSLGAGAQIKGQEYRVRITSRTESQFTSVNAEGRTISCTRP